jgi:hypothetical protein
MKKPVPVVSFTSEHERLPDHPSDDARALPVAGEILFCNFPGHLHQTAA